MNESPKYHARDFPDERLAMMSEGELNYVKEYFSQETSEVDLQMQQRKPIGRIPDEEYTEYRQWLSRAVGFKYSVAGVLRRIKNEITRRNNDRRARNLGSARKPFEILVDLAREVGKFDLSAEPVVAQLVAEVEHLQESYRTIAREESDAIAVPPEPVMTSESPQKSDAKPIRRNRIR